MVIGLDGLEPSLAERWMDDGRLPNLAALRASGAFLRLQSTTPPATFPAWTSCVTGVGPGRHGIFDFTEVPEGSYNLRFVNSRHRKAPALWDILSAAGRRVCVVGVPATYPPDPVNGIMVSGFDSPVCTSVDRSFVYPPEHYEEVRGWRFADFQESHIGPGWHEEALRRLLAKIDDKERILLRLIGREPWDFLMAVFGESDTVAHHFWLFHDPASPRHRPGLEDAIRLVYERLDAAVGRLIGAFGEGAVAVVSDHGFGGAGDGVVHLNNWLAERGHLGFAPARDSLLKRAALAFAPQRWRGALFRRFQGVATRAESRSRTAGIDWSRTRAWSEELNYFPSIRVNLRGREPNGQVAPEDYTGFCTALCRELEEWPCIARAWRRSELYRGPHVERAPDIILELATENGYSHSCLRGRGGPAFRRMAPHEYLGGKERGMTGNHRPEGVLFLSRQTEACAAAIEDVAPTVLAAMNMAGPPMDGTSLLGDMMETGQEWEARGDHAYTPAQEQAVEQRLRDLGYFE